MTWESASLSCTHTWTDPAQQTDHDPVPAGVSRLFKADAEGVRKYLGVFPGIYCMLPCMRSGGAASKQGPCCRFVSSCSNQRGSAFS